MNVFIMTDSRGSGHYGWTYEIEKTYPQHQYLMYRSDAEIGMATFFKTRDILRKNEFDVMFIQAGYNEGVEYYSERVFKELIGPNVDINSLIKDETGDLYRYWNLDQYKYYFEFAKLKCKRLIYIGFHNMNYFRVKTKNTPTIGDNARTINKVFSELATETIHLPQSKKWCENNTREDRIHYNKQGSDFIVDEVSLYL